MIQKIKNIGMVIKKLMQPDTFFDSKKRYFGTLILVITEELATKLTIPSFVD
jgi:hypothetical protein